MTHQSFSDLVQDVACNSLPIRPLSEGGVDTTQGENDTCKTARRDKRCIQPLDTSAFAQNSISTTNNTTHSGQESPTRSPRPLHGMPVSGFMHVRFLFGVQLLVGPTLGVVFFELGPGFSSFEDALKLLGIDQRRPGTSGS